MLQIMAFKITKNSNGLPFTFCILFGFFILLFTLLSIPRMEIMFKVSFRFGYAWISFLGPWKKKSERDFSPIFIFSSSIKRLNVLLMVRAKVLTGKR